MTKNIDKDLEQSLGKFLKQFGALEYEISKILYPLINENDQTVSALISNLAIRSISLKVDLISILLPHYIKRNKLKIEKKTNKKYDLENEFQKIKQWKERTKQLISFRNSVVHAHWTGEKNKILKSTIKKDTYIVKQEEITISEIKSNINNVKISQDEIYLFFDMFIKPISPFSTVYKDGKVYNVDNLASMIAFLTFDAPADTINHWIKNPEDAPENFLKHYNEIQESHNLSISDNDF